MTRRFETLAIHAGYTPDPTTIYRFATCWALSNA